MYIVVYQSERQREKLINKSVGEVWPYAVYYHVDVYVYLVGGGFGYKRGLKKAPYLTIYPDVQLISISDPMIWTLWISHLCITHGKREEEREKPLVKGLVCTALNN